MSEIKQFKLTNDDEIICEVVQWDSEDNANILVRRALKIINVEDFSKGMRFFAFRPWMLFNDDPESFQTINAMHIIGELNPSDDIITRWRGSVTALTESKKKSFSLDDVAQAADELDDEEFDRFMYSLTKNIDDEEPDSDSPENVIKFKPRLH
jgi:hypothetical protein